MLYFIYVLYLLYVLYTYKNVHESSTFLRITENLPLIKFGFVSLDFFHFQIKIMKLMKQNLLVLKFF